MSTSFDAYAKQAEHELGDQAADAYKIVNQMLRGMRFHPSQLIDAPANVQSEQPVVSKQMTVDAQQHETEAVRSAADTQVKRQAQNTPKSAQQAIAQQTKKLSPDAEAVIKQEHDRKHGSAASSQTPSSADKQADDLENDLNLDDFIHRYLEDPASESSSESDSASASASAAASAADSSAGQAVPAASAEPQAVDGVQLVRDQSMSQASQASSQASDSNSELAGRKTMTLAEALANSQRLQRAAAEESESDIAAEDAAARAVVDDQPSDDDIPVDSQNQHQQTEIELPPMRGRQSDSVKTDYHVNPDALADSVNDDDDDDDAVPADVLDDDDSQKSLAELQNNPIIAKKSSMKNTVLVGAVIGVIIVAILAVAFL